MSLAESYPDRDMERRARSAGIESCDCCWGGEQARKLGEEFLLHSAKICFCCALLCKLCLVKMLGCWSGSMSIEISFRESMNLEVIAQAVRTA